MNGADAISDGVGTTQAVKRSKTALICVIVLAVVVLGCIGDIAIQSAAHGATRWDWNAMTFTTYRVVDVHKTGTDVPTGQVIEDCRPAQGGGCGATAWSQTVQATVATALGAPEKRVASALGFSLRPVDISSVTQPNGGSDPKLCNPEAGDTTHAQRAAGIHDLALVTGTRWSYRVVREERSTLTGKVKSTKTSGILYARNPDVGGGAGSKASGKRATGLAWHCLFTTPPWATEGPDFVSAGQLPTPPAQ
ncbi:MAG: hypothetical protein LBM66_01540 [Bifidobacteriaceae bacterium]|jgi:hypothetical protein|nr:hypothetical protein [Bifidobacteriaceae bacterium]